MTHRTARATPSTPPTPTGNRCGRAFARAGAALFAALALSFTAAAADAGNADVLRVGSKRFTESYILAEVVAQTAAPHTTPAPVVLQGLGNTAIVYAALQAGSIDVYPEYAGTIAQEILKSDKPMSLAEMNRALAPRGLVAAVPLGFNDGYALALREADALRWSIRTVGDLRDHPELKLGLSNEFLGRADGWKGLAQRYRLPHTPIALDHGLAYDAMAAQQIDVIDIYTTDAKIGHLGLRVLQDDLAYFPRYDAVLLLRQDVPRRFPQAWAAISQLEGSLDEAAMIALNAQAELKGMAFDRIAQAHLAARRAPGTPPGATPNVTPDTTPAARGFLAQLFGPDLARLTGQHVALVLASVALATLLAVPLAVLVFPHPRARMALLGATGVLQTVPSLALLAMLISLLGAIGTLPALMALTLYALLPIMRNTVTGLASVPQDLRNAALALGLRPAQCLRSIELPLALPTIVAGVRTASAISIGTATIAAFIGAGGLGERIVTGLALNDRGLLLAGALPAAALALLSEGLFEMAALWMARRRH